MPIPSGALTGSADRLPAFGLPIGTDERLARLAAAGSERAFAVVYERYHQRLYRYVRSMLRHEADAQDALQSTFTKAFDALARGQRDAPLRPWLYRIAHNEAITIMRRRRPELDLDAAGGLPTRSAAEEAGERARIAQLIADLGALTDRQRGALVMRELSGLSHGEIETALGLSPGGGKQTVLEARRSLAEFAEGRAMHCDEVCRAISEGGGRTLRGRGVRAHLRDCRSCAAFAAAIPSRSRDLRALAPPLPAGVAAGLFARSVGASSVSGSGGGTTGLVAGAVGKAAALTVSSKILTGAALIVTATAAAGAAGALKPVLDPPATQSSAAASGPRGTAHAGATLTVSHAAALTSVRQPHTGGGSARAAAPAGSSLHRGRALGANRGHVHAAATTSGAATASHGAKARTHLGGAASTTSRSHAGGSGRSGSGPATRASGSVRSALRRAVPHPPKPSRPSTQTPAASHRNSASTPGSANTKRGSSGSPAKTAG